MFPKETAPAGIQCMPFNACKCHQDGRVGSQANAITLCMLVLNVMEVQREGCVCV